MKNKIYSNPIFLIFIAMVFGVTGQLILKKGMNDFGKIDISSLMVISQLFRAFFKPLILIGLVCYMISTIFWLVVLSKIDLSFAYPMVSISYVFVSLFSWIFLGEQISFYRWSGIAVICLGIFLISRSNIGGENDINNYTNV